MKRSFSHVQWGKAAALITQQKSIVCLSISLLLFHSRVHLLFFSRFCAFPRFSIIRSAFLQRKIRCSPYCALLKQSNCQKGKRQSPEKKKHSKAIKLQHRKKKQARKRAISIYHNQQQKLMGAQKHQHAPEQTQTTSFLSARAEDKKGAFTIKMCWSK